MADLDWSLSSSFVLGAELPRMDPLEGAARVKQYINSLDDWTVLSTVQQLGLNHRSDVLVARNRLERYYMRKAYGPNAAPWDPRRDEWHEVTLNSTAGSAANPGASVIVQPSVSSERPLMDISGPPTTRSISQPALPTGQSLGPYRDPITLQDATQTFVSQVRFSVGQNTRDLSELHNSNLWHPDVPMVPCSSSERRIRVSAASERPSVSDVGLQPRAQSTHYQRSLEQSSQLFDQDLTGSVPMDLCEPVVPVPTSSTQPRLEVNRSLLDEDIAQFEATTYYQPPTSAAIAGITPAATSCSIVPTVIQDMTRTFASTRIAPNRAYTAPDFAHAGQFMDRWQHQTTARPADETYQHIAPMHTSAATERQQLPVSQHSFMSQ